MSYFKNRNVAKVYEDIAGLPAHLEKVIKDSHDKQLIETWAIIMEDIQDIINKEFEEFQKIALKNKDESATAVYQNYIQACFDIKKCVLDFYHREYLWNEENEFVKIVFETTIKNQFESPHPPEYYLGTKDTQNA